MPVLKEPSAYAFTVKFDGRARALTTWAEVSEAFDPALAPPRYSQPELIRVNAVWDTGATGSVISDRVITELGLLPIDRTIVHTAGGTVETDVYVVNIGLPNGVMFTATHVTRGQINDTDVLIGMDIIGEGDFAVTGKDGKTWMSFSVPSNRRLDFVDEQNNIDRKQLKNRRQKPPNRKPRGKR